MNNKLVGVIETIQEVQSGESANGTWKKIGFTIKTEAEYDNLFYFTMFGEEKVDNFQQYNKKGDKVEVSFNIKCREWTKDGKTSYFTNLDAWKVFKAQNEPVAEPLEIPDDGSGLPF